MRMDNLSTTGASIVVKIGSLVVSVDGFDPNSDILSVNDRQTADGEVTPDGIMTGWAMRSVIETSFTVIGSSIAGQILQSALNNQARGSFDEVTITVINNGNTNIYTNGILTTAKPSMHLGNQKMQPITFNFKFGDII
ncbi:TPA: hypothetical protein RTG66_001557 [Campylobacter jejuni]|nr:hypothetical protein [Campylobacter jejuni]